jgi:hypothetical protein
MKITFAFLIIVFLAFSGYHLSFRNFKLPLFARQFYLSGTEFLFLGLLLGPHFFNLFDQETQKGLAPVCALLLGWIGLLTGFQFEIKKLRRFPAEYFLAATLEGCLTMALVFCTLYFTLPFFIDVSNPIKAVAALTLAAAAACTAQTSLVLMAPASISRRRNTVRLLRYLSSIDCLGALLIFGLAFIFHPPHGSDASWIEMLGLGVLLTLGTSIGLLLLFTLFLSQRRPVNELILIVIGMTILTSGTASAFNFSPLLTNAFLGFWLVNLSRDKERIYQILLSIEKPVYLLLLVFLGIGLHIDSMHVIFFAAVYCLYRISGKFFSGFFLTGLGRGLKTFPRKLGFGLLEQGGLTLAILLDFRQAFPSDITAFFISLAILAMIYNEFLSPHFLRHLLTEESK